MMKNIRIDYISLYQFQFPRQWENAPDAYDLISSVTEN